MKHKKYFTKERARASLRMDDQEFDKAMQSLLEKGLMEEKDFDGIKHYRITQLGKEVYPHVSSEPSERN